MSITKSTQSLRIARTVVRCTLSLTVLVLPTLACRGEAQSRSQAAQGMEDYRLTAPMVRKVSVVMREWNPVGGLGALMFGEGTGMTEAQFNKLPEEEQSRVLVESRSKAEAKEAEGRKMIEKLLVGTLDQRIAEADRIQALKTAIAHAGLSTREFVPAFVAYHSAMDHLQGEEMKASYGEAVPQMRPGVFKDNVDLIRPMEKAESLWSYLGG
jgi:hypothetical protein